MPSSGASYNHSQSYVFIYSTVDETCIDFYCKQVEYLFNSHVGRCHSLTDMTQTDTKTIVFSVLNVTKREDSSEYS